MISSSILFRFEVVDGDDMEYTYFLEAGCLHEALDRATVFADRHHDGIVASIEFAGGDLVSVEPGPEDVVPDTKLSLVTDDNSPKAS